MSATLEDVWARNVAHAGQPFNQMTGGMFHYRVDGARLVLDRAHQALTRAHLEKAHALCPLSETTRLQDLRGPSYVFAILTREHQIAGAPLIPDSVKRGRCACSLRRGHDGGEHSQEDIDETVAAAKALLATVTSADGEEA